VDDELIGMASASAADNSRELRRVCLLDGWTVCAFAPIDMAAGSTYQRDS
jgi:hypothetical protein